VSLKLEDDLDILNMYRRTKTFKTELELKQYENRSRGHGPMSEASNYFEHYGNRYSDEAPTVSDQ